MSQIFCASSHVRRVRRFFDTELAEREKQAFACNRNVTCKWKSNNGMDFSPIVVVNVMYLLREAIYIAILIPILYFIFAIHVILHREVRFRSYIHMQLT